MMFLLLSLTVPAGGINVLAKKADTFTRNRQRAA
jgi:hypothetical protein